MRKIKVVGISKSFFNGLPQDKELLHGKDMGKDRPFMIMVNLNYRGRKVDFAIPFRSKLSPRTPKDEYKSLPPRPTTPKNCAHGLHYTKMFPIKRKFLVKFNTNDNSEYYQTVFGIIERDISEITQHAQKVVNDYEAGIKSPYTPNWENIIKTYFDDIKFTDLLNLCKIDN